MAKLLDARTSQNASENDISIPVMKNTPTLFAQVGLDAAGAVGTIRATMTGTIALDFSCAKKATATIRIVRGTLDSDPVVLQLATTVGRIEETPLILTFSGADFNPPFEPEIIYTVFLIVNKKGVVRTGPESFFAQLYSD